MQLKRFLGNIQRARYVTVRIGRPIRRNSDAIGKTRRKGEVGPDDPQSHRDSVIARALDAATFAVVSAALLPHREMFLRAFPKDPRLASFLPCAPDDMSTVNPGAHMLTITQDWKLADGQIFDYAEANGLQITRRTRATCRLAALLISLGHSPDEYIRVVRADPLLFPPPQGLHRIRLRTVAKIDFFAELRSAHRDEIKWALERAQYDL